MRIGQRVVVKDSSTVLHAVPDDLAVLVSQRHLAGAEGNYAGELGDSGAHVVIHQGGVRALYYKEELALKNH